MKRLFLIVVALVLLGSVSLNCKRQASQEMPRSITLGTHAAGSLFHAVGSGLASVLTKNSGMEVVIAPHPGPVAWIDKMASGELEMGLANEAESRWIYDGAEDYKPRGPSPQLRMLRIGHANEVGVMVPSGSSIQTLADLRGKKIAWPVSGHASYTLQGRGILAQAGLSENDIVSVPAESFAAAGRLVLEGRAEVVFSTTSAAMVKEISDAKGGVRFIPMKDDAKSVEIMAKIHPGKIAYLKPGETGVTQPTAAWAFDAYIVAWDKLSDAVAYQVVKTLSEHYDELAPIHPVLKRWTPEAAISGSFSIPVHSGAIKYYKEKGMWTKEIDALQKKLLAGK